MISAINSGHVNYTDNTTASAAAMLGIDENDGAAKNKFDTFSCEDNKPAFVVDIERMREELKRIQEQADAMGEGFGALTKALRISMRIMAGDNVPDSDDKFLLENFPEMHMRAWMLRRMKEDPVDHKSVLDDDNAIGGNCMDKIEIDVNIDSGASANLPYLKIKLDVSA